MKRKIEIIDYILGCGMDVAKEIYVECLNKGLVVEKVICDYCEDIKGE